MRRPKRLTTGLALSAAAALLLTACGDNGGDNGTPSPSDGSSSSATSTATPSDGDNSSSSTTASPTASATPEPATSTSAAKNIPAPEMPEAMKTNDQAGLEAALEYWWETEHYLKTTGDSVPMADVSTEDCVLCEDLIANWPRIYEADGWAVGQPSDIVDVISNVDNGGYGGTMIFAVYSKPGQVYRPGGELVEQASSEGLDDVGWSGSAVFDREEQHWKIDGLSVLEG